MPPSAQIETIRRLLHEQRFATLATASGGAPYTSLVAFSVREDLRQLLLVTGRATRKYANLSREARVALLVDDTANREADLVEAAAVTALGTIHELTGGPRDTALPAYLQRHPRLAEFAAAPSCALLAVEVEKYLLVTHFQQVYEYTP